jgi:iron complex transport system substrate-binding protein
MSAPLMPRRRWLAQVWPPVAGGLAALGVGGWPALASAAEPARADKGASPRLISLSGGMTEVVYRLGAEHLLVATDTTSTYPMAALKTPKVGYMRQLSAEGVLSLRPTALLGTQEVGPAGVLVQLRQAGVALHLVKADHSFDELLAKVRVAAEASLMPDEGKALQAQLQTDWRATQQRLARAADARRQKGQAPRKVLFVMNHGGSAQGAGKGTAAQAMIDLLGAVNVLDAGQGYKPLTPEAVAQAAPDVILTTQESIDLRGSVEAFWQQAGLAFTPAARQRRLVSMDAMALLGFGPRLPQVLDELNRRLA